MNPKVFKVLLPLIILLGGVLITFVLAMATEEEVKKTPVQLKVASVYVADVKKEEVTLNVYSQGTVKASQQITLLAEVSGQVVYISESLKEGASFKKGDVLIGIDPKDYELKIYQVEAKVAEAEQQLYSEQAEADIALQEWKALNGKVRPNPLTIRAPQLKKAKAQLKSAQSSLQEAKRNLKRCEIKAPFEGRVLRKQIDKGQFVAVGTLLAEIFNSNKAELRLPINNRDMGYADFPLNSNGRAGPEAELTYRFGNDSHTLTARIVRVEGEVDPQKRVFYVVAEIEEPYKKNAIRPPLYIGMFVTAKIEGKTYKNVISIDNHLISEGHWVWVVDKNNTLNKRKLDIVYRSNNKVWVSSGIEEGEKICLSTLNPMKEGMPVLPRKKVK